MMSAQASTPPPAHRSDRSRTALMLACVAIIAAYVMMIDLKGISTDEGIRVGIINGGRPYVLGVEPAQAGWGEVLATNWPYAYQPLYFLLQNTLMSVARTNDVVFLRLVNVGFLWVSLMGLVVLTREWRLTPRLFLLGIFGFNAYLIMHVLQIREYIAGVAFYIWSTWFVLRLDARPLGRTWADVGWFTAYGLLLATGFYLQSWIVFPAIGQGLFLAVRRGPGRLRFYAHLALSYLTVYSLTWPYLATHRQKVDVGRWGELGTDLGRQLNDGFHFVLTGHQSGRHAAMDALFWFWLAVLAAAGLALLTRASREHATASRRDCLHQGPLVLACMILPLGMQVAYFFKHDNLSVWPRYFVVHYFFLYWLLGLGVRHLHELGLAAAAAPMIRRLAHSIAALAVGVMIASAVFQVRSYYRDPLVDTSLTVHSNWRTLSRELSLVLQPGDVVLTHDFISRATLSFTRPLAHRIHILAEVEEADLQDTRRLVYLEPNGYITERTELAARLARLGFGTAQELPVHVTEGRSVQPEWRFVAFSRP